MCREVIRFAFPESERRQWQITFDEEEDVLLRESDVLAIIEK